MSSQSRLVKCCVTCQEKILVSKDTDAIIHQAKAEVLEEWRSDKVDSFENNDGCLRSEWMEYVLEYMKAFLPAHRCEVLRITVLSNYLLRN